MSDAQKRYVDSGSYDRGAVHYKRSLSLWTNFQLAGGIIVALGVVIVAVAVNEYSRLDLTGMGTVALVGLTAVVIGLLPRKIGKYMIERFRHKEFLYRLAIHFMKEMGIKNSAKVLTQTPRFLESFEEVITAVAARQALNAGATVDAKSSSLQSHRIGSLMLRDEKSLTVKPILLSLIAGGAELDYDSLTAILDRKIATSKSSKSSVRGLVKV